MSQYFVGHAAASALFGVTVGVWAVSELLQTLRRRTDATRRERGSRLVIGVFIGAGFVLGALARTKAPGAAIPGGPITFWAGLAVTWAGIGLRWWCFATLGRYFTVDVMTSADQPVITTGPYRMLRHPSYSALLLIFAGIGVIYANWVGLAALVLLPLIGLVFRIRVEEAALSAALGDAYRSFAADRKRLVPHLW